MTHVEKQNSSSSACQANSTAAVIDRIADGLLAALSGGIICIVLTAVFFRYVLNHSLSWSDELVRYLFVWFTMLGAAVTLREREHIRVDFFVEKLAPRYRRMTEVAMLSGVALFQAALIVLGGGWVWATRGSYTSALQWPLNLLFYAALPSTAALALWYTGRRLWHGEFAEREEVSNATPTVPGDGGDPCKS